MGVQNKLRWLEWQETEADKLEASHVITQAEKLVFISSMAALADGGEAMEELDISALYYAALEEADGTVSLDEEEADEADYYQQLEDELAV